MGDPVAWIKALFHECLRQEDVKHLQSNRISKIRISKMLSPFDSVPKGWASSGEESLLPPNLPIEPVTRQYGVDGIREALRQLANSMKMFRVAMIEELPKS